jgi:cold shock CspA family protein
MGTPEEFLMRKCYMAHQGRLLKKGNNFGFLRYQGRDVFVHFSNYLRGFTPELNQQVEFEFGPSPREDRPPVAIRVRVVKSAAQVEAEFKIQQGGAQ